MKMLNKKIIFLFLCFCPFLFSVSLFAVSKENNDLLFIINLYEHNQYNLAKQQIGRFEQDYPTSDKLPTVLFIKADIAFQENDFTTADNIYSDLMTRKIDNLMLTEVLLNRARIRYEQKNYLPALDFINSAERLAATDDAKYKIAYQRGEIYLAMLNPLQAIDQFELALDYKHNDPAALEQLLNSYLSANDPEQAQELIKGLISENASLLSYTSVFNTWLDYLIGTNDCEQVLLLEQQLEQNGKLYHDSLRLRFAQAHILQKDYPKAKALVAACSVAPAYRLYLNGLIEVGTGNVNKADSIFAVLTHQEYSAEDVLPDAKIDLAVAAWLERIKILYQKNPNQALQNLKNYLAQFPLSEQDPFVLYTYGSLLFQNKQYQEAVKTLLQLKQLAITPELEHNVIIMLGDIWFNAKVTDNAIQSYNDYLNLYPRGKFRAHSIYNLALIYYDNKNYAEARVQLQKLSQTEADPEIREKADYLSAEIDFYQAAYSKALQGYNKIAGKFINQVNLDYRRAQCYYYLEDYATALSYIQKLEINSDNAYQIYMLQGNIYFNLLRYAQALDAYRSALQSAKDETEKKEVNSYLALTLYRLQRFSEAKDLYLQLSSEPESASAYLLMAAKSSYHAKDYEQALVLFKKYVQENPEGENTNYALANIANIYYNQGDYARALPVWLDLLNKYQKNKYFTDEEQAILANVFTGLQWGLLQSKDQRILDEINNMIDSFSSEYIKFELEYLLLKVYYGTEEWSDILQLADELRAEFPQRENNEIRRLVAASLAGLNRTEEADSVYRQIFALEPTPDILTEWAELQLKTGNYSSALAKLEQAFLTDKKGLRFVKLLNAALDNAPDSVEVYWKKYSAKVDSLPDQARFILLKSKYYKSNWQEAKNLAENLILNPDYAIRSQAQLIYAVSLYRLKDYDNAIMELYRTCYLYAHSPELVLEAKRYLIKAYWETSRISEARTVLEEIRADLSADEAASFDTLLNQQQH